MKKLISQQSSFFIILLILFIITFIFVDSLYAQYRKSLISGYIRTEHGDPIEGVEMMAWDAVQGETDANGYYDIEIWCSTFGTFVWPSKTGWAFSPESRGYTGGTYTDQNYTGYYDTNSPTWLRMKIPNGGENWLIGNQYTITWEADQFVGQLKLEISTDAGQNWWDVTQGAYTANDGSYSYTPVIQNVSTQCLIKVTSISNQTVYDQSDAIFTIKDSFIPTSWTSQISNANNTLFLVKAVSDQVAWVAGGIDMVLRTIDGGQTWENVWSSDPVGIYCVEALDGNTAFAGTYLDGVTTIYKTTNGGANWTKVHEYVCQGGGFIKYITMFNSLEGIAIGDAIDGKWAVLETTDGGNTWQQMPGAPDGAIGEWNARTSIRWLSNEECWMGVFNGPKAFHTINKGLSWTEVSFAPLSHVRTIDFSKDQPAVGLAASDFSMVRTTNNGASWQEIAPPEEGYIYHIIYHQGAFWALNDYSIYKSYDNGSSWELQGTGSSKLRYFSFVANQTGSYGWSVGSDGIILKYEGELETPYCFVDPASLDFGETETSKTFIIGNNGVGTLNWSAITNESWITSVTPSSGTDNQVITVTIDRSGLNPGNHTGKVFVTSNGGNPEVTVTLTKSGPCAAPYIKVEDFNTVTSMDIQVPVSISGNPVAIDAFGFKLDYCAEKLTYTGVEKGDLTSNYSFFQGYEISPGTLTIGGFHTTAIPIESEGIIAIINFHFDAYPIGETCNLSISNLSDDIIGLNICNSTITFGPRCPLGDVNNDGSLTPGDALCAFQIYLQGGTPPAGTACDNECALIAADINCTPDGITPGDALYIFQGYLNGKTLPLDCKPAALPKEPEDLTIHINSIEGRPGDEVVFTVELDRTGNIQAFGLDLGYPTELLTFVDIIPRGLTKGWDMIKGYINVDGVVTIGGFNPTVNENMNTNKLVDVIFSVNNDANGNGDVWVFNLTDDLSQANSRSGHFGTSDEDIRLLGGLEVPSTYSLEQNYPNPFNMNTEIMYQLPEAGFVNITIYNSVGHQIRTLVNQHHSAGKYAARWDGKNDNGINLPSGVYIYHMKSKKFSMSKKMLLIK